MRSISRKNEGKSSQKFHKTAPKQIRYSSIMNNELLLSSSNSSLVMNATNTSHSPNLYCSESPDPQQTVSLGILLLLFFDPGTQFPRNEKNTLCNTKKYKNQAGMNLTPPPPSQNSHAVRWHCTAESKRSYLFLSPPAQSRRQENWARHTKLWLQRQFTLWPIYNNAFYFSLC